MEGLHPWIGPVVTVLLSVISILLGLILWFSRQMWAGQVISNKEFKETCLRLWKELSTKVSDTTCQEREKNVKCNIASLESDFRKHSHTGIEHSKVLIKE